MWLFDEDNVLAALQPFELGHFKQIFCASMGIAIVHFAPITVSTDCF